MLSYNQVTNSEINKNGVSIKEIAPIMKLNLRGKKREFFTNVGKCLNIILPTEANTSSSSDKLTAIWLSPDEWMIVYLHGFFNDSGYVCILTDVGECEKELLAVPKSFGDLSWSV